MDTRNGDIYKSKEEAIRAGVPEKRLVQGSLPTLRKLRKMIRKQSRSMNEKRKD